uniref:Uncharacterized protein n=1 Tax=Panagrolaimus sp. ES5 TaxID=591445 RepID=A0AC34EZU2_9BILA
MQRYQTTSRRIADVCDERIQYIIALHLPGPLQYYVLKVWKQSRDWTRLIEEDEDLEEIARNTYGPLSMHQYFQERYICRCDEPLCNVNYHHLRALYGAMQQMLQQHNDMVSTVKRCEKCQCITPEGFFEALNEEIDE